MENFHFFAKYQYEFYYLHYLGSSVPTCRWTCSVSPRTRSTLCSRSFSRCLVVRPTCIWRRTCQQSSDIESTRSSHRSSCSATKAPFTWFIACLFVYLLILVNILTRYEMFNLVACISRDVAARLGCCGNFSLHLGRILYQLSGFQIQSGIGWII